MNLTPCGNCGAQYNTSTMAPGSQFQCSACGAIVAVGAPVAAAPQAPAARRPAGPVRPVAAPGRAAPAMPGARGPARAAPAMPAARGAAGYPQQGGYAPQPGYGPQGQMQQPQMPGGMPYKKKSNTTLIVVIISVVALIGLIVIVAVSGGGGSPDQAEADALAKEAVTWDFNTRVDDLDDAKIKRLSEFLSRGLYDSDAALKRKLGHIQGASARARMIREQNKDTELLKEFYAKARQEIRTVGEQAYDALMKGDKEAFARLVDFAEHRRNLMGKGYCVNDGDPSKQESPSSYNYDLIQKKDETTSDGKNVYAMEYKGMMTEGEMREKGIQNIFDYFSPKGSTVDLKHRKNMTITYSFRKDKKESGTPDEFDIFGVPEEVKSKTGGGNMATPVYYGLMFIDVKGLEGYRSAKPLALYIGGEWKKPAMIYYVFADIAKPLTTRFRDDEYYKKLGGEYMTADMADSNYEARHSGQTDDTIEYFDMTLYSETAVIARTDVKPTTKAIREGIDRAFGGNAPNASQLKALMEASDTEKLKAIGYICDLLLNAQAQGQVKVDQVLDPLCNYGAEGTRGWKYLTRGWTSELGWNRDSVKDVHMMAFRYRLAYDRLKAKISGK